MKFMTFKNWLRYLSILLALASLLQTTSAVAQTPALASRLLLHFTPSQTRPEIEDFLRSQNLILVRYLAQIEVWVVEAPTEVARPALERLAQNQNLDWIEADGLLRASEIIPNDPYYLPQQYNLRLIQLPRAWSIAVGTRDWPVAVIDTGIDLDHPDLAQKLWMNPDELSDNGLDDDHNGYIDDVYGWNFVADNSNPQDDQSHGSHVAGIIAAQANNEIGIAGIAWQTPVMAVKVLNSSAAGNASDVAAGILYAADNGARILNLSLGDAQEYQVVHAAVLYAHNRGCLIVAAAGNTGGVVEYPAAQAEALAVAATNESDQPTFFSSRGPQVDLSAPGVDIFSADRAGFYYHASGTSAAAPQASGLAALVWGLRPEWSAAQVTQVITSTAHDVWANGRDDLTGWGRISAPGAVDLALYRQYLPLIIFQTDVAPDCPADLHCLWLAAISH